MHIHVVGVSGTGMGSLAGLLVELGHRLTGSDVAFDPPMGPALRDWGVSCLQGFDAAHIEPAPDLIVVGNVCRRDNVEVVRALELGLPYTHIAGALQRFVLANTSPLVVAGTHGKTTTSALAAFLLDASGLQPGFLIGGIPNNFARGFRAARSQALRRLPRAGQPQRGVAFVVEGDEYDTAFFEKTAKFLHYSADVAIVTSIEHDHVDIYPTPEAYLSAFESFVAGVPETGLIVANAADASTVRAVQQTAQAPVTWYALEDEPTHGVAPHWLAAPAGASPRAQAFDLYAGGVLAGRFALPLPGRHNLSNATAAIAAAAEGYGVPLSSLAPALAGFQGVRRRQELLGTPRGVHVYDDFAHHPTAVEKTLQGLRAVHPRARLFAVFEPRSATACRNLHQQKYADSFDAADTVLLAPLGRSGLPPEERLDLDRLVSDLVLRGKAAARFGSHEAIVECLREQAGAGDVIALLSNGAFGGIHQMLLGALEAPPATDHVAVQPAHASTTQRAKGESS